MGSGDHPFCRSLDLIWPFYLPIPRWHPGIILAPQPLPTNQAKRPFMEIMR
jgi:hypothetical protein